MQAAEVLLDLTSEGVDASSTDLDDRRYVFQIIAIQLKQQQPVRRQVPNVTRDCLRVSLLYLGLYIFKQKVLNLVMRYSC